jgi:hypothetical protein
LKQGQGCFELVAPLLRRSHVGVCERRRTTGFLVVAIIDSLSVTGQADRATCYPRPEAAPLSSPEPG